MTDWLIWTAGGLFLLSLLTAVDRYTDNGDYGGVFYLSCAAVLFGRVFGWW